jgi:hypothetical protein
VHLRAVVVPVDELDPVAQRPTRFDAERRARAQQYVQGMSDRPGSLVAVAELVRLGTQPRCHRAPCPLRPGQTGRARARTPPHACEGDPFAEKTLRTSRVRSANRARSRRRARSQPAGVL